MGDLWKNKRLIILVLALSVIANNCFSQSETKVQPFEASAMLGGTFPLSGSMDLSPTIHIGWGAEARYNLQKKPLSFGLLFEQTIAGYKKNEQYTQDQTNRTSIIALSGDWNFHQGKKINPFAGLAAGMASLDLSDYEIIDETKLYPVFIPRIGVEIGYHLRTQLDFVIVRKGFSNVFLSIGGTIGGRAKK